MELAFSAILAVALAIIFVLLCAAVVLSLPGRIPCEFVGKHVFITGGSKGIGKAIAREALLRGSLRVSIAARDPTGLANAVEELKTHCRHADQRVDSFPLDLTKSYKEIRRVFEEAEALNGPIDVLVNNAGFVVQGGFDELDLDTFESQLRINYLSAVYATRAVIEGMQRRGAGRVAFVSSAAAQCAIWGYGAYSPSKFALRGFAEAMHMELLPHNIGVSILYPPNTATEGYQEELRDMPEEVREIGGAAGLFTPAEVARQFVDDMCRGEFATTIGSEGWMLGVLTAGAAPEPNAFKAITQTLTAGLLRAVMLFYLGCFNRTVHKCHEEKERRTAAK